MSFGGDKKSDDASAEQKPKQQEQQQTKSDVPDFVLEEFEELDGDVPF